MHADPCRIESIDDELVGVSISPASLVSTCFCVLIITFQNSASAAMRLSRLLGKSPAQTQIHRTHLTHPPHRSLQFNKFLPLPAYRFPTNTTNNEKSKNRIHSTFHIDTSLKRAFRARLMCMFCVIFRTRVARLSVCLIFKHSFLCISRARAHLCVRVLSPGARAHGNHINHIHARTQKQCMFELISSSSALSLSRSLSRDQISSHTLQAPTTRAPTCKTHAKCVCVCVLIVDQLEEQILYSNTRPLCCARRHDWLNTVRMIFVCFIERFRSVRGCV